MFEHIKEGDSVYEMREIRMGYSAYIRFAVEVVVTRTTKTQLVIGNHRFSRDKGRRIGSSGSFHPDIYPKGVPFTSQFNSNPEIVSEAEFRKLDLLSRKFKEIVGVFFPNLEPSQVGALFRNVEARYAISNAAQTVSDSIRQSLERLGVGHLTKK